MTKNFQRGASHDRSELKILKTKLPKKWGNKLAVSTKLSVSYIYKVMDGSYRNETVIQAAIDLAYLSQGKKAQFASLIEQL